MSIIVPIEELAEALAPYPWGYLLTVGETRRSHALAVPTDFRDGALHLRGGRSSLSNAATEPQVTMVFPHPAPGGFSLIVDGIAQVDGDQLSIAPQHAILHRPAISAD
ncbi:MAG: pyridoxamine 5'-phosphate oxidase family protein [Ilumatobacteraceae bacterium]